jgi:glycogen debranching enzyme
VSGGEGRVRAEPGVRGRPQTTMATLTGGATLAINHGSTFLVAARDGSIGGEGGDDQGLYADDTRFLSRHALRLNGVPLRTVATSRLSFRHARWSMTTEAVRSPTGIQPWRVSVTLDRIISDRRLHEDIAVRSYSPRPVALLLSLQLESDFADVFEVRTRNWQRRGALTTVWRPPALLDTRYRRDDFWRRAVVRIVPPDAEVAYANGELRFAIDLEPGAEWRTCLQHDLLTSPIARAQLTSCPGGMPVVDRAEKLRRRWHRTVARAHPSDLRLLNAFDQAIEDFAALRLYDHDFSEDVWVPAAGVPWFVAVFGRDSIIASLQALPVHPLFAVGTLQKLAQWQSDVDDPVRDAEPGKICHEMRTGEWAHFHTVPHSPYYGTADATPLYLLLLGEAYRWLGDPELLHRFRGAALHCLEWIDRHGDRDGDGFQEYEPRTPTGYRNHCWRDAEDGVLDEHGNNPPHPIGTCEMQGYVYAAKLAVAELFAAWGDGELAAGLRTQAAELRRRFHAAYWDEASGELAFALDGDKRRVMTATSNPGHCLWTGILDPEPGALVADRLMRHDLFSGWGLRTLSTHHPAYDPHSYQRGSVWPHDTVLAAAGLRRYGRTADAWALIDGILSAASAFERSQLPELFAGLGRVPPDAPVPYESANVPQAWAAGSVFHALRVLLGLEPDVPAGCVYIDPALPPWCPQLQIDNVRVGPARLAISAWRLDDGSSDVDVEVQSGHLRVVRGRPPWLEIRG